MPPAASDGTIYRSMADSATLIDVFERSAVEITSPVLWTLAGSR